MNFKKIILLSDFFSVERLPFILVLLQIVGWGEKQIQEALLSTVTPQYPWGGGQGVVQNHPLLSYQNPQMLKSLI